MLNSSSRIGKLFQDAIRFAIQPDARRLIENCEQTVGIPATWVQASKDLVMDDLLKNLRSSQIFSVCGLLDARTGQAGNGGHRVDLLGLDVFDPVDIDSGHREGTDVPARFLDTDYNGLCALVRRTDVQTTQFECRLQILQECAT